MKIIECDKEHKEKWNNAIYNRNYYIELSKFNIPFAAMADKRQTIHCRQIAIAI